MDDLLENTTVIPLVQLLAHICRVVVSKVWIVFLEFFVRRRRRRCSVSALKARRVASVYLIFSFVCSLAAIPRSASSSSSDGDNTKQRCLQVPTRSKTRNAVRSAFWRKRAVVLVKSGVDLETRI